ncbi:chemotaxis protein CheW [Aromatoleum buckelii]|uniref:Chemotaxis protein CheW n=1 Tax=Aromatoleum buckelii TaxID=200254 RepID=A0ABX1N609_9RHOO|nr:chemotaxis protein CheW [Aromatoleum buckelii]MCK0509615.1 chemotaxis protein CheW [Aromatoleum buckelii]
MSSILQVRQAVPAVLAGSQPVVRDDAGSLQYLTFSLNSEMFAVGILNVKEIIEYGGLTQVPMMPAFIRGVINLRGAVVPVIDLSARFANETTRISKRTCIVIMEVVEGEVRHDIGIMVDMVSEVLEIPAADIEPPPSFGARIRADFIDGMGKVAGKFVILLNIAKVLSTEEISTLAAVYPGDARNPHLDG